MTTYSVDTTKVDWDNLLANLKNNPSTTDFEHFKHILPVYWNNEDTSDRLQTAFKNIYEEIANYHEKTQAFLLSIIFDYPAQNALEGKLPGIFDKLMAQETSPEHHFLIIRYMLAYKFQYVNIQPSINDLKVLLDNEPDEQIQAYILIQAGVNYGYNIYAEATVKSQVITLLNGYVSHPNRFLRYVASLELLKSQNFETPEAIIKDVISVFAQPAQYVGFYYEMYVRHNSVKKLFLFSDLPDPDRKKGEKIAIPEEIHFLSRHISLFQQTGQKQFTHVTPLLLNNLLPENHNSFIIQAIMLMVFGDASIQSFRNFNDVQKLVLETLITKQWLWEDKITGEILEAHEIPQTLIDLQVLLNNQSDKRTLPDFSKLYEVDWKNTTHAYGEATDVPQQIMRLCSDDNEIREQAWWQLWGNLFHQGSRYPASVLAVPYLIDLLNYEQVYDKPRIMQYLLGLMLGYPEHYIHSMFDYDKDILNFEYEEDAIFAELYHGVAEGIPVYIDFLENGSFEEKQAAVFLLAWFYPFQKKVVPALRYFIEEESNELVQANMLLALSYLTSSTKNNLETFFKKWYDETSNEWIKLAATIALYRLNSPQYRQEVLSELLKQLGESVVEEEKEPDNEEVQATNLPWVDEFGNKESFISGFFEGLDTAQTAQVSKVLLEKIKTVSMFESLALNNILFRLNFGYAGGQLVDHDELDKTQLDILKQLLTIEQVWKVGNFTLMLKDYGLPGNKEELENFLMGNKR